MTEEEYDEEVGAAIFRLIFWTVVGTAALVGGCSYLVFS